MNYLHGKNIVHRDLKSTNCLVFEDWTTVISDFGLARRVPTKESSMIGKGKQYGTPLWMAPEVIRKEVFTKAADVFSFSIVVSELITGWIPYEELDILQ